MKLYKTKFAYRDLLITILIFCTVLGLFWYGFTNTFQANSAEKLQITRTAVQKSIVNCYAVEGTYPPDIKYLEDHYGIVIDHSKYIVNYELAGSNVMPSVEILEKGSDSE
ncbi:MAG: hypothetical protein K0Q85_534 [Caproiciproducens sp.]|nr:hypothetical protein [Caproiciproducens sp.]